MAGGNGKGDQLNQLNDPRYIFIDEEQSVYVSNTNNHRVMKWRKDAKEGRIVAGGHGEGTNLNQLSSPRGVIVDSLSQIYVADFSNNRVMRWCEGSEEAFSFNQPKFSATPIWNSNGITFTDQSIVGSNPHTIFVNTNNTIYVANVEENKIVIWHDESVNPTKIIRGSFIGPRSLFVTSNGDIYIDDGYENGQVQRWSAKTNSFVTVMNVNLLCYGLFVDINDTLYCSMVDDNQVVKKSLNDPLMTSNRIAAGTGIKGSDSNQLYSPHGIFVDINLDLYVTDCGNDRVQLFQSGESNGIAVAGSESLNPTIALDCPTGIILDTEKYLYIVDQYNSRIVGSGLNGFRCLVGCYRGGSQSNQLYFPFSFSFDRSGNILVTDQGNHRIQKFLLMNDSFGK
ncbi:unnamed protein product [Adineta steineri]|uniref:NHL repeat containing protein n=1 Tax=Adineta steineri TaxID=433720 RepID=A0A819K4I8_9BILA|nr:unnamed protein product [Adineta steineri]CAF3943623.1 unnamed protein product [Adineta steineri]